MYHVYLSCGCAAILTDDDFDVVARDRATMDDDELDCRGPIKVESFDTLDEARKCAKKNRNRVRRWYDYLYDYLEVYAPKNFDEDAATEMRYINNLAYCGIDIFDAA